MIEITWDETHGELGHPGCHFETKIHYIDRVAGLAPPIVARITPDPNEEDRWYWEVVTAQNAAVGKSREDFICLFWRDDVETVEMAKRHAEAALTALITGESPPVQVQP